MGKPTKAENINRLKADGYKMVNGFRYLYINPFGSIYNLKTGKYSKKIYIKPENNYLSVAKLVLQAFRNEPYRNGHITFIDGNKENLSVENIKYNRLFESNQHEEINHSELLKAIRCYFEVERRFNTKETCLTRLCVQMILGKRGFLIEKISLPNFEIYKTFITGVSNSIANTAKEHKLSVRDCAIVVNEFTNLLVKEILQDLEAGLLCVKDYKAKAPTQTQVLKQYNEELKAKGLKPVPVRKQSAKEQLKKYTEHQKRLLEKHQK
jgi:hypothetical protein